MHILLRPVPGLSATLERRQATFLVAAAKCTNIDSDIPRQAPPAITGHKMAPRGTRKNALLATWTRGCLARVASAPAGTGAGSALPPHPSLPAAVVASTVPTSITDAISTADLQPAARYDQPAVTMRLAVSLATISQTGYLAQHAPRTSARRGTWR